MTDRGFTNLSNEIENSNDFSDAEKPIKIRRSSLNRVDINILKSKLQKAESKEFKKNLIIFIAVSYTHLTLPTKRIV